MLRNGVSLPITDLRPLLLLVPIFFAVLDNFIMSTINRQNFVKDLNRVAIAGKDGQIVDLLNRTETLTKVIERRI